MAYEWPGAIAWIVYFFVLVWLWRLSSKNKEKDIKWGCWILLILLAGASVLMFFGTCLGIGAAMCY